MNKKTLLLLLAVFGVLVFAVLNSRREGSFSAESPQEADSGKLVFKDLNLDDVKKIRIAKGTNEAVELVQDGDGWVVRNRYNFPASFDQLSQQLRVLPELEVGQSVPGGLDMLEELGLSDEQALTLSLFGDGSDPIVELKIGNSRSKGTFSAEPFAMLPGKEPFVLNSGFDLNADPDSWIVKDIVQVPFPGLVSAKITHPEGAYTVVRGEGNDYALMELKEGETSEPANISRIARALESVYMVGVADPLLADSEYGLENAPVFEGRTDEGVTYTVTVGKSGTKGRFVRFGFSTEVMPEPSEGAALVQVLDEERKSETTLDETNRTAKVQEKLASLMQEYESRKAAAEKKTAELKKFEKWIYILNDYQADAFCLPRSALLAPIAPEDKETGMSVPVEMPMAP